jgi:hypothetical protein
MPTKCAALCQVNLVQFPPVPGTLKRPALIFWVLAACLFAVFLIRSQLYAYVGDESFHLLAAQLIKAGKKPYIDFFYQHTPLYIYLTAGLFRLSETWRIAHAFSALSLAGSVVFACCYVRDCFTEEYARRAAVLLTLIFYGLNCYTLIFGATALPYGFCLFCSMAALYFSRASDRPLHPFVAGIFAGAAVASNLLTVPVIALIFIRILLRDRRRVFLFITGAIIICAPLLILFAQSPGAVSFNLVGYHLFDRPGFGWRYNVRQLMFWFASIQSAMLIALAIPAIWLRFRRDDDLRWCGLIAFTLIAFISCVKTVSAFYLLLAVPFLAILAAVGAVEIIHKAAWKRKLAFSLLVALYIVGLFAMKQVWRWQAPYTDYREIENIARLLQTHASDGDEIYAFEAVYFASHRLPPPTLENRFNPLSQADDRLKEYKFDIVCIGVADPKVEEYRLLDHYARSAVVILDERPVYILSDKR